MQALRMKEQKFLINSSHKELLSSISNIDLKNLSINTKNSDFGAYAVKE